MTVWVGTSGYNYPEWKGSFYPADLPASRMLAFYSSQFDTVEINNTFYRMPLPKVVSGWVAGTPERFRLTLKAPQAITHHARLRDCADRLRHFLELAALLGDKRGVLLFQLPPNLKCDVPLLERFLALLPAGTPAAFEFRHASWFDARVFALLAAHNLALCIADSEKLTTPVEITADYAYFRLRDEGYEAHDIERWARVIRERAARCRDSFVYFKHEESGTGPAFARQLRAALAS